MQTPEVDFPSLYTSQSSFAGNKTSPEHFGLHYFQFALWIIQELRYIFICDSKHLFSLRSALECSPACYLIKVNTLHSHNRMFVMVVLSLIELHSRMETITLLAFHRRFHLSSCDNSLSISTFESN